MRKTPINTGLNQPRQVDGVDVKFLVINAAVTIFFLVSLKVWAWLAMTFLIHQVLKMVSARDPNALNVYIEYSKQGSRYEPWADPNCKRNARPEGFGGGAL